MTEDMFGGIADRAGWSDAARVSVLLRYAATHGTPETLAAFLTAERAVDDDPAARVTHEVMVLLRDPGLALDAAFRGFCARSADLLTTRQIAERWCCWRTA